MEQSGYTRIGFSDFEKEEMRVEGNFLMINTPVFSDPVWMPMSFILIVISGILIYRFNIVIIFFICILIYFLWKIFESFTVIKIDRLNKILILTTKNPIKYFFKNQKVIRFAEIEKFVISERNEGPKRGVRYVVSAVLKDSGKIYFTQSFKAETSKNITSFLNKIIGAG